MKIFSRKSLLSPRKTQLVVAGALLSMVPTLQAASPRPLAPPVRIERGQLHTALSQVRVWTPSETLPRLPWADRTAMAQEPAQFSIPAGLLEAVLKAFETQSGITVTLSESGIGVLPSPGVTGRFTPEQALATILSGTSVSYRFIDGKNVALEIRLVSDAVQVSGALPQVESPKYSAPLVDTPQTIQVIPQALIQDQGARTLTEAMRNVPGITLQAGEGGGASSTSGDMFTMRGFSAANSMFVDGVRDDGLISRDVYNLEQVEVFSGPTGSDVGRMNAAGYINLVTKTPHLGAATSAGIAYGAGEEMRATFDVNQPLTIGDAGTFLGGAAIRVNGLWQDGGVAGRDHVERQSKSIAPSITLGLNTPTRVSLAGQIMRQDNLADYGLPAAASPIGPLAATGIVAATPVDQGNYYGSPDYDYDRVSQDSGTLRLEHDISPTATVRNQTRYNRTEREAVVTSISGAGSYNPATNLVTLSRQGNERENKIFSNQTALSARLSTGRVRHAVSVGMELSSENQFSPSLTGFGTRAPVDLHNPDVFSPVTGMAVGRTGATSEGDTNTLAFYLFDGVELSSRVQFTGGLRVERYDTTSRSVTATAVATEIEGDGTLVSGKAGVLFRLNEIGNVYASYGSSLTPPGSANFQLNAGATNQNNPNIDPQKSTNYELGTKWDLAGRRLQLSGAVFRTENTNVIFVVDATAIPPVFNQDDGQLVTGGTVGLVGRLTPWWDATLNLQYLDGKVESQNPNTNGHQLALTPQFSGSIWTTARLPKNVRIGGGFRYSDSAFISTANTTAIPSFGVADLFAEAPLGQRLLIQLNIYNVTDHVYIRGINNNAGRYTPGTPRSILLTANVRF